jgi:hypothetical protein
VRWLKATCVCSEGCCRLPRCPLVRHRLRAAVGRRPAGRRPAGRWRAPRTSRAGSSSRSPHFDLWYVTQTIQGVSGADLDRLRVGMLSSPAVELYPVDVAVSDAYVGIGRGLISDPWYRLIVATALALHAPLVTRDGAIRRSEVVETVWLS